VICAFEKCRSNSLPLQCPTLHYQTSQLTRFDRVTHGIQYVLTVSRQAPVFTRKVRFSVVSGASAQAILWIWLR